MNFCDTSEQDELEQLHLEIGKHKAVLEQCFVFIKNLAEHSPTFAQERAQEFLEFNAEVREQLLGVETNETD